MSLAPEPDVLPSGSGAAPIAVTGAWPAWVPPLAAALLAAACVALLFWPGYMSWDSAYQWWQARNDQFESTHPPLLAMIWQFTDSLLPGPGGLLLLQLGLLWGALAMFAASLPASAPWRVLMVLVIGLWPPLLGLQVHLWKDLWTLIGFAVAVAALARDAHQPWRAWRVLALLAIAFACAFRHNAISGAIPLLLWIAWREVGVWKPVRVAALTLGMSLFVLLLAGLPARDARVRPVQQVWSVVTLWDAAAVSLAEDRLVFPALLMQPGLTLDELRGKFVDYSNTTVFELGKLRHSLGRAYSEEERAALHSLAWQLPTRYPRAYFSHRLRLAELLYGLDPEALPAHQVLALGVTHYGDNPVVEAPHGALNERAVAWLRTAMATPVFAGWTYLVLAAAVMAFGLRSAGRNHWTGLATVMAASALSYALPLAVASGSAEFRYLAWPIWASLAALALLIAGSRFTART